MNVPRLIIADEPQAGKVSPGLILIYAMKRAGINVRVFTYARDEADVRLLRLLLEEPVASLDQFAFGNLKNMKTLFQKMANPDAVNVILVPLGFRPEENLFQVLPDAAELSKLFSCGIVMVLAADASSVATSNVTSMVLSEFETAETPVLGVVFASVKNAREYQMLEQEYGRRTSVLSLGYLPKENERPMPSLQELCSSSVGTCLMQIKSSVLQLLTTPNQIEWQIVEAFACLRQEWSPVQEVQTPPKNFKIAIVGDRQFSLESSNSAVLFQTLGCRVVDYDPWGDVFPIDVEAVYFPHSLPAFYADRLLSHEPFVRGIRQSFTSNKLIFASGASALLFAKQFTTVDGQVREGLNFFPFSGSYSSIKKSFGEARIEIRGIADSIFCKREEKMRGYALDYINISNPGNVIPASLAYRDIRKGSELGVSGWVKGYCFITDLRLELWSNIDIVNRWLSLRKR